VKTTTTSTAARPRVSRGPLARVLASLWLVLHVFVVAALPVADGFADHGGPVVMHVEDADGGDCPSPHGESCELCQFAHGMRALVARSADFTAPVIERRVAAPDAAQHAPAAFDFLDGHSSRAPPALG
jgi:hypothetical protein